MGTIGRDFIDPDGSIITLRGNQYQRRADGAGDIYTPDVDEEITAVHAFFALGTAGSAFNFAIYEVTGGVSSGSLRFQHEFDGTVSSGWVSEDIVRANRIALTAGNDYALAIKVFGDGIATWATIGDGGVNNSVDAVGSEGWIDPFIAFGSQWTHAGYISTRQKAAPRIQVLESY